MAAAWQGGKKKKKMCNWYGNAQMKHHDIHSGVIEGPEGSFVPEGQEDSEPRNDMQEGRGSERGGLPKEVVTLSMSWEVAQTQGRAKGAEEKGRV